MIIRDIDKKWAAVENADTKLVWYHEFRCLSLYSKQLLVTFFMNRKLNKTSNFFHLNGFSFKLEIIYLSPFSLSFPPLVLSTSPHRVCQTAEFRIAGS